MIDLGVVIVYFLFMLFVGWKSRRQSAEAYWVAERRYATGRITMSLVATIFGASSTIGIIGLGYARGLTGAWWSLVGGLALIPCAFLLASRVRRLNVYTLPDILKKAYGERVAVPAGMMIALAWCGVIAAQLVAGGRLLEGLFAVDLNKGLIIVAVVFTLYTFWGGQLSVIRTDLWQLTLFLSGLVVALLFLCFSSGGVSTLFEKVPPAHWHFPVSATFGWYDVMVFYPLIVGFPYLVGPDIYSRIFCAKDARVASRAVLSAALMVIPLSFVLAFFGLMAHARFPLISPEAALPETLTELIPVGLRGIIAAGFLGAIMSSADTCLISASTILTLNVLRPLRDKSPARQVRSTRIWVLLVGLTAWFIASREAGIISSLLLGYTVFVGGVVCPTLATFFNQTLRITPNGALWAVIMGGGTAIIGKIQGGVLLKSILTVPGRAFLETALGPKYLSILPIVISILTMFIVSRIRKGGSNGRKSGNR